jgi:hypothetical protein
MRSEHISWYLAKTFAFATCGYIAVLFVVDVAFGGRHLAGLVTRGAWFGLWMTAVAAVMHLVYGRRHLSRAPLTRQSAETIVRGPMQVAVSAAREALEQLSARDVRVVDGPEPVLLARAPMNLRTWGDKLSVTLTPIDEHSVRARVESRPRLASTLVDYGKSFENVERICTALGGAAGTQ